MDRFVAIDFETANPKRVSACAIGYAIVENDTIVSAESHLIKPVGGHAPFQTRIHGITERDTFDKPNFGELFPSIRHIFDHPLVAHSAFDKQVLKALAEHFDLPLEFDYEDTCRLAKQKLPGLKNHKLKTLAKHFDIPPFRHHDPREDAIVCAQIYLRLRESSARLSPAQPKPLQPPTDEETWEFLGMAKGILADDEVNYKEAYALLYWLQDHPGFAAKHRRLYDITKQVLEDDILEDMEAERIKQVLRESLTQLNHEVKS